MSWHIPMTSSGAVGNAYLHGQHITERITRTELEARATLPPRASGGLVRMGCSFHGGDHQRSLVLDPATGRFHCWSCGAWGYLDNGAPPPSRRERQAASIKKAFSLQPKPPAPAPDPDALEAVAATYGGAVPLLGTPGAIYLLGRHLDPHHAAAADVRYAADFYGRPAIIFPMCDRGGHLVAVSGRYIDGMAPKTRHMGRAALGVFATPAAWAADPQVLVEGPVDALVLAQGGQPAIALMGKDVKPWLMRHLGLKRVVLALDADVPGVEARYQWADHLQRYGAQVGAVEGSSGGKDWADLVQKYPPEQVAAELRSAVYWTPARPPHWVLADAEQEAVNPL